MKKPFTRIASVIFGLLAAIHLIRLVNQFKIMIGVYEVSLWISIVGVAAGLILCIGLWRESGKSN